MFHFYNNLVPHRQRKKFLQTPVAPPAPPAPLTPPTPPTPPTPGWTSGNNVVNQNVNPMFFDSSAFAKRIKLTKIGDAKAKLKRLQPDIICPKAANGKERCLSWHFKGRYYHNYGRKNDHITLFGEDDDEMVAYDKHLFPDP